MKKTLMLFSALLIGAFILFGFQNSINFNTTLTNNISAEDQNTTSNYTLYQLNSNDIKKCGEGKCGAGKCGSDKPKVAKKISKETVKAVKKDKCGGKCGEGKCGGGNKKANCNYKDKKDHGFMSNDKDGDGKVSKAEFTAHHEEMFAKMDKNNDGFISTDEAKDMHKAACNGFDKANCTHKKGENPKSGNKKEKCGGKCGK